MKKPVIILADPDYGYLEALEIKYIEKFGTQTEMEVITDPEYFTAFFSYLSRRKNVVSARCGLGR